MSPEQIDFRAEGDDAWYSATVELDGDVLRLKYCDFSDKHDQILKAGDFKSLSEIELFEDRFRPASVQAQDFECSKVLEGDVVCASATFEYDDLRFYDALVDGVEYHEHARKQGEEEECLCTFILYWLHGPKAGNLTATTIGQICQIQPSGQIDPKVASFLKLARERFLVNGSPTLISKGNGSPNMQHKKRFLQCLKRTEERIVNHLERATPEDMDFGGVQNQYVIMLENLDKGLSPSKVAEFIHRETSISPLVYVFPSLTSELSNQGALMLDCKMKFQELSAFLDNPNHIIMSSIGRPWVIIKKISGHDTLGVPTGIQMLISQKISESWSTENSSGLKLVYLGTEEFRRAKLLKDFFVEFFDHHMQLRERLALDVEEILKLQRPV